MSDPAHEIRRPRVLGWVLGALALTMLDAPSYLARGRVRIVEPNGLSGLGAQIAQLPFLGGGSGSSATAEVEVLRSRPRSGSTWSTPSTSWTGSSCGAPTCAA